MSLDTETLKTILATSTPSPWEWFAADGDIMLVPNDCKKLPIMSVVARKGSNEYYLDFHNPLTDKMDDGRDVCGQNSNAKLIALAPALAAEVIRLRERLAAVEGERDEARKEAADLLAHVQNLTGTGIVDKVLLEQKDAEISRLKVESASRAEHAGAYRKDADEARAEAARLRALLTELADAARAHQEASREVGDRLREACAEVERLRQLVNPSTPAGKLAQWKAAEELRKNPPKVATAWEPTERKGWWARHDVHGVVIALAGDCGDFFADTSGRESSGEPSLEAAKKAADETLKAAGWELVGGAS